MQRSGCEESQETLAHCAERGLRLISLPHFLTLSPNPMNLNAHLFAIVALVLTLCSCDGNGAYAPTEEDKKLGDVYAHLALLSESNRLKPRPDTGAVYEARVDSVLTRHQMTKEEFRNHWDDLSSSSDRTRAVLDIAARRLEILRREAK